MTNLEHIKNMSSHELGEYLCDLVQATSNDCGTCPFTDHCRTGKKGSTAYLELDNSRIPDFDFTEELAKAI